MTPRQTQFTAAAGTLLIALLLLLWLLLAHIQFDRPDTKLPGVELAQVDDEFFDVIDDDAPLTANDPEQAAAFNEVEADYDASEAPAPGTDLADQGPQGPPPPPVTANEPATVKEVKPKKPTTKEIAAREKQRQEDEARRKAESFTANAFSNSGGKNNAQNNGANPGNAGKPSGSDGNAAHGIGVSGRGSGKWALPTSTNVIMQVPGKITFRCTINPDGSITGFELIPQQTSAEYVGNNSVIQKLKAEITSHIKRQTSKVKETEPRTARITYTIR